MYMNAHNHIFFKGQSLRQNGSSAVNGMNTFLYIYVKFVCIYIGIKMINFAYNKNNLIGFSLGNRRKA